MLRLSSRGFFGELGLGDLDMLLLRLRIRKDGGKDRVVFGELLGNFGSRNFRVILFILMFVV